MAFNETLTENETFYNYDYERDIIDGIKEYIRPKLWTWCLICSHILVFVIGLVGNALVCIAVFRNRSMRTVTNYFIMNLAIADFLVILICLPPTVIWDVTSTWFFGTVACKMTLYLQTVSVTVSVLTLTFISIDRWYAICFPLKFRSTTGRAKSAIVVIWILALIFDIPELVVYHTEEQTYFAVETHLFTQCKPSCSGKTFNQWILLKMLLLYLVPLAVMATTYCNIIYVLWKPKRNQHELDIVDNSQLYTFSVPPNGGTRGQLRSRKKAAKMLVSVVVMFAVCYFPIHLHNILRIAIQLTNSDANRIFSFISHWLCYANSAVNPLIYNFMSGKFRKEFKRSYDCCCNESNTRNQRELLRFYKKDSLSKSMTSSRQSRQKSGSDFKRTDTITTKITE